MAGIKKLRICRNCQVEFYQYNSKFWWQGNNSCHSRECFEQWYTKESHLKCTLENKNEWVECPICTYRGGDLGTHYKMHQVNYKELRYPVKSKYMLEIMTGPDSKNPWVKHGGKYSPFSNKSIVHSKEIRDSAKLKMQKSLKETNKASTKLNYWIKKCNGNEELAKRLYKDRQQTFTLEKCILKLGEVEGRKRWEDRQEKWLNSYKKSNFSKISQNLFNKIIKLYIGNIYYATYERLEMKDFYNKEFRLKLNNGRIILPDFIDLDKKKIIEFDGDYFHSEAKTNKKRDEERDFMIINSGYSLLHIKESDYNKKPEEIIEKCLNFLT